ncbi:MAG: hypothetical protein U1A27_08250 [Phycisphaerae bacterium]
MTVLVLVGLHAAAGRASTIVFNDTVTDHRQFQDYGPCGGDVAPANGLAWLDPYPPEIIPTGGTSFFDDKLSQQFPTWQFSSALNPLNGRFIVSKYKAVGACNKVGAQFTVFFDDGDDDLPPLGSTHWIQVTYSNHPLTGAHGTPEYKVDIAGGTANPYYDRAGYAGPRFFEDDPSRPDALLYHYWVAELYLVEQTAANSVIIHDGIRWGWRNRYAAPEPSALLLLAMGGLVACPWRKRR